MTDMPVEIDELDANWIAEIRRRGGVAGPAVLPSPTGAPAPPTPEQAHATVVEFAYPNQPRDRRGRFGSGGGTSIGVSRERPELGGGEIHTYADLEAARKNPVIAEAERTTTSDLEQLDIDVTSQRQVAGVFEGGGEPSLSVKLGTDSTVADIEIAGAYMVRRNEQDSVIVTVGGAEMERLGLAPNATTIRVEGLPTDQASRERLFKDIQDHTPFASWDEKRGTVAVSSFDADIDDGMRAGLAGLAETHGARMTAEPVHERWYFQNDQLRADAKEYLHPADPSVLRTPDEVRSDHPDDERTAAIPGPRQERGGPAVAGGAGAGQEGAHLRDHPPGAVAQGLTTWAYSPGQKRDTKGRFGSGGGGGVQTQEEFDREYEHDFPTPQQARERLEAVGIRADMGGIHDNVRGDVTAALESAQAARPDLFKAMDVRVEPDMLLPRVTLAETRVATYNGVPDHPSGYRRGQATIALGPAFLDGSAKGRIKEAHAKGWLAGDSVDHAVQHEVGHVFDGALDFESGGQGGGSNYLKAVRDGGHAGTVSAYGKTSPGERFAEEYAQLSRGEDPGTASAAVLGQLMGKHG